MKMMARVVLCILTLSVLRGGQSYAQGVAQEADQVVVACTRNFPSVSARTLDFSSFVGFTCGVNGQSYGMPVSLVDSGRFSSTWIFVHGNQIPPHEATKRGIAVYERLRSCSTHEGPIRFVIWSWPSERNTNRLKDAKIKSHRTNVESFLLGSYIAAIAHDNPLRLVGYSFGARIVGGALHLSSGGQLDGHVLPHTAVPVAPHRVVMLAAAIENDGFLPGGRYRHGLDQVEHMLLMNNSRDQALRFYWILNTSKPKALGSTGFDCRPPHVTVHQYDWADQIGKDHSLWQYLDRPFIIQRMAESL